MAKSRVKGITIEIDGETTGLDKALSSVNKTANATNNELRDVNKLLKLDPGNVELVAQKQELLSKAVANTETKLGQLKSAQSQVEAAFASGDLGEDQYRSFQREVQATDAQLNKLKSGLSETENYLKGSGDEAARTEAGFKKAKSGTDDLADSVDTLTKVGVGEYLQGVADKAAEIGGAVLETGMGFADANSLMQSSMGMTAQEAKAATDNVKGVFNSGLVDSVDEATQAVMTVKNSFQDLNGTDLTNMTNQLQAIANHTGNDLEDVVNASSQAMKNFGISGKEASDVVAKGLQLGLDKNHDFLDSVNEYAPQFKDAGLSAENMLSVMNAGMKDGSFNTDKAADAVKEFNLRLTGGQLEEPMKQFSDATQDVFQQFKDGKATTADVMASVGEDLAGMPADEAKLAVQGLGTQFEDLGQGASASLLKATKGTEDVSGAADKLAKKTPTEKFQSSINKLQTALSSMVSKLTPVVDWITKLVDAFSKAPGPIQMVVGVIGAVMAVLAVLMPVITTVITIISAFGAGVLLPLIGIVAGVIATITAVILIFQNWGAIVEWVKGVFATLGEFFSTLWATIKVTFNYALFSIATFFESTWQGMTNWLKNTWTAIANWFGGLWDGIKSTFNNALNAISNFFSRVWNSITSTTQNVFNGIRSFISSVWNNILSSISNILNGISNVVRNIWGGITNTISNVVNGIRNTVSNVFNAVSSTVGNIFNGIRSTVSSIWNGIKDAISTPINAARDVIGNAINAIKGFFNFSISWPKIPMPHFSVSPKGWEVGDLLKGKIPKLGIDWYAKGGVFTKPTLFANNGGGFSGVGEAGPEAVVPLNEGVLAGIGAGIVAAMGDSFAQPAAVAEINQYFTTTGDVGAVEAARQSKMAMRQLGYNLLK